MTRCRAKLQSRDGASIILAMTIFLICGVLSITVVNGALSTVHNMTMQQREEQAYLTVTSAARLFAELAARDMAGTAVKMETRTEKHIARKEDEEHNTLVEAHTEYDPTDGGWKAVDSPRTYLQNVFWELIKSVEEDPAVTKKTVTGSITVPDPGGVQTFNDVQVSLTYDNSSSQSVITAAFTMRASDDYEEFPAEVACRSAVRFICSPELEPNLPEPEETYEDAPGPGDRTETYYRTMKIEKWSVERGRWTPSAS